MNLHTARRRRIKIEKRAARLARSQRNAERLARMTPMQIRLSNALHPAIEAAVKEFFSPRPGIVDLIRSGARMKWTIAP